MRPSTVATAAALSLAIWLGGCAAVTPAPDRTSLGLSAGQALYVAEAAFAAASAGLDQASTAGALTPSSAAHARQVYEQAHHALEEARAAEAAGEEVIAAARASDAIAASAQLGALQRPADSRPEAGQ